MPPRTAPPVNDPHRLNRCSAQVLVDSLRTVVSVGYAPLARVVARLDTTRPIWVLTLDIDSPAEDHCWAMVDVLKILNRGAQAADHAQATPHLSLVRNGRRPHQDAPGRRSPIYDQPFPGCTGPRP